MRLYETDESTGSPPIEQVDIKTLCKLAKMNESGRDVFNMSREVQEENLHAIEHAILMHHSDEFTSLTPS